jgi:hypothetical protein
MRQVGKPGHGLATVDEFQEVPPKENSLRTLRISTYTVQCTVRSRTVCEKHHRVHRVLALSAFYILLNKYCSRAYGSGSQCHPN